MVWCQRHPNHSSSQVQKTLGSDVPWARTIQRIRARNLLHGSRSVLPPQPRDDGYRNRS